MNKVILVFLIVFSAIKPVSALFLDVNIYHNFKVKAIDFSPTSGKYTLEADERIIRDFHKGISITISPLRDSVLLQINHRNVGLYKEVSLYGRGFINSFSLSSSEDSLPLRFYDDNLKVRVIDGRLQLLNNVDLEHYVAGVVQAEVGGSSKDIQFFYVQAVSCRTYALVNYLKHTVDGYNLCDQVHCQYYLGKSINSDIIRAVARTSGEVIIDSTGRMISAAFHSNCGGETVNSEDVWTNSTSYLKSRIDTFCTSMSKAKWEVTIAKDDFLTILYQAFDFPLEDSISVDSALHFTQEHRKVFFIHGIPLKRIRQEFGFRSTFFSIESKNDSLLIKGRGFGHGVGLCQQGAIKMAELGINYHDIIKYYYKDTRIIHYSELKYNFMP